MLRFGVGSPPDLRIESEQARLTPCFSGSTGWCRPAGARGPRKILFLEGSNGNFGSGEKALRKNTRESTNKGIFSGWPQDVGVSSRPSWPGTDPAIHPVVATLSLAPTHRKTLSLTDVRVMDGRTACVARKPPMAREARRAGHDEGSGYSPAEEFRQFSKVRMGTLSAAERGGARRPPSRN